MGFLGCCHLFSKSAYMIRIITACALIFAGITVFTAETADHAGITCLDAADRLHWKNFLIFFVETRFSKMSLSKRELQAIDDLLDMFNTGFDDLFHVCSADGKCRCNGKPVQIVMVACKVHTEIICWIYRTSKKYAGHEQNIGRM